MGNLGNVQTYPAGAYPEIAAKRAELAQTLAGLEAERLAPLPKIHVPLVSR
jgi:hypothetical protein